MIYIDNYILNPIRLNKKKRLEWFTLWINRSEYLTSYYESIKGKYEIIDESINYYIIMIEMGIYYLKDYNNYYDYFYIQHRIIMDSVMDIKEDIKERDFAEYLKYLFYKNESIISICSLIEKYRGSYNLYLIFVRLLFPSYYLYYFERVVTANKDYDKLQVVVNRSTEYEEFLKLCVNKINEYLIKKIVLPF